MTLTAVSFGSQLCQRDSYEIENDATVVECRPLAGKQGVFEVVLSDSVFFAEGGGQPDDKGAIGNHPVISTLRDGSTVRYRVAHEFQVGEEVKVQIDWDTRLDYMQQHSAQHLISAVAEKFHKADTESWSLAIPTDGETVPSTLILSCPASEELRADLETKCNYYIRKNLEMKPQWVEPSSSEAESLSLDKLPEGTTGPLRVVSILGLDDNMCCGTHVQNLGLLQAVKIVNAEPFKSTKCKLTFAAGERVIQMMSNMFQVERQLNKVLSCPPSKFEARVTETLSQVRSANKMLKLCMSKLASSKANELKSSLPDLRVFTEYEPDFDGTYVQGVAQLLAKEDIVLFLAYGTSPAGFMLLAPKNPELCATLGPQLAELLNGKGGGGKGKFQGKCNKLKQTDFDKAAELVRVSASETSTE